MNSIRAYNAIIDLLKGAVDDVHTVDVSSNKANIEGGDAENNVDMQVESNEIHEATVDPTVIDSDSEGEIKGGAPAIEAIENIFLAGGSSNAVNERNEFADIAEGIARQDNLEGGNNKEESFEEKEVEAEDFEPVDVDGKEPVQKDDEGDPIEDNFNSDNDNEEEEETNEFDMKGGTSIQRVHMITADLKFPFILKSRQSK